MFDPTIANTLPNGAIIIRRRCVNDRVWIWLADFGGYQRYVTWVSGPDGDTHWGNYFCDFSKALGDFYERIREYEKLHSTTHLGG